MEKHESFIEEIVVRRARKNRFLCTAPDVIDFVVRYTSRDEQTNQLIADEGFKTLEPQHLSRLYESFTFIDDLRQNDVVYTNEIYPCFLISDEEFAGLTSLIVTAATEQV